MITVKTENYNLISQDFYNKTIDSLDLNLISCVCGHSGCLIRHGSYKRSIQLADRILSLSVVRVYCKICGHPHALLLSSMVPDSQIPLALHVRLIQCRLNQPPINFLSCQHNLTRQVWFYPLSFRKRRQMKSMKQEKQQEIALMRYGAIWNKKNNRKSHWCAMAPSHRLLQDLMNVIQARPLFKQKSLQKHTWDPMGSS